MNDKSQNPPTSSIRIDKWLWAARFYKTRSLAGKIVSAGDIRVTRALPGQSSEDAKTQRVSKSSFNVQIGDVLSFSIGTRIIIVKILGIPTRRGPAPEAQSHYQDLSPPPAPKADRPIKPSKAFERIDGAGRPTKKERRALDKVKHFD